MASIEEKLVLIGSKNKSEIDVAADAEDFQHAEHNIEQMDRLRKDIIELLKDRFRFDAHEEGIIRKELKINGDRIAEVQGESRFSRTPYAKITEGMENHLLGIRYHAGKGGKLPDVIGNKENPLTHAQKLLDDFDIILGGCLKPTVEYNVTPKIKWEKPGEYILVPANADKKLSANSVVLLAQIDSALPAEKEFAKAYKKAAAKGSRKGDARVTESASGGSVVEAKKIVKAQIDYTNVVRSLIEVPMEHHEREWEPELPYLIGDEFDLDELRKMVPWYNLTELKTARPKADAGIYVGVRSVYDRIQELKEEGFRTIKIPTAKIKKAF